MQNLSPENLIIGLQRNLQSRRAENNKFSSTAIPTSHFNAMRRAPRGFAMASPAILLLGLFCLFPAWADIYTYTDNDGMVYLSNAPTNKRYQVLVSSAAEHPAASPLLETKRTYPGIAGKIDRKLQYDQIVEEVAGIYGMDSALLHAVISVESNYNPKAVSKQGASGMMQLMPVIARHYGVVDSLDPVQNIHGGAEYLHDMLTLFDNDVSLAVAAYNAGETAVVRHGNRIPPFQETMDYVQKVLSFYREYQADRPRPSAALNVKAMVRPLIPGDPSLPNAGNANVIAFASRKYL